MSTLPTKLHRQMIALGQIRCCLNCYHFTPVEDNEDMDARICAVAGRLPPATIIVYGCESWLDLNHDIPF